MDLEQTQMELAAKRVERNREEAAEVADLIQDVLPRLVKHLWAWPGGVVIV